MKKIFSLLMALCLMPACLCACRGQSSAAIDSGGSQEGFTFIDAMNHTVTVASHEHVAALQGSLGELWLLAGGALEGVTSDAIEEGRLEASEDIKLVGSAMTPNLEEILMLSPDFVILSADMENHLALDKTLSEAEIPHAYFRLDTFSQYMEILGLFCEMTGESDLYEQNGLAVQQQINQILENIPQDQSPTVLLIRAYSSGARAKTEDNLTGAMLKELGCDNIASRHESLLEELSIEEIIMEDPDYIFVLTMGSSSEKALETLHNGVEANPAWNGLSAVQNGRYIILPKELFHYKPNARWGESYEYLAEILYPQPEVS